GQEKGCPQFSKCRISLLGTSPKATQVVCKLPLHLCETQNTLNFICPRLVRRKFVFFRPCSAISNSRNQRPQSHAIWNTDKAFQASLCSSHVFLSLPSSNPRLLHITLHSWFFNLAKSTCKLLIGPAGLEPATPCLEGRKRP